MEVITTQELSRLTGVSVDKLRVWHRSKKFGESSIQFVPNGAILWKSSILEKLKND